MTTTEYFDLVKIINAPISAYGEYKHAKSKINLSLALETSMGKSEITLSPKIKKYYDKMPNTEAQIENPNW